MFLTMHCANYYTNTLRFICYTKKLKIKTISYIKICTKINVNETTLDKTK